MKKTSTEVIPGTSMAYSMTDIKKEQGAKHV